MAGTGMDSKDSEPPAAADVPLTKRDLEECIEDLNNRSRQNYICIRGLPVSVSTESVQAEFKDLLNTLLPDAFNWELAMYRAHRALQPLALNPAHSQDVIVHIHHFWTKERLLHEAWLHQSQFQDNRLSFY
ncbi:Hypothetical predicted protein [Pelobates cultripes]|uniref:Uncharacterized protein n=1 Tax=Pelobates cultripes TaxID=61616 RepID=A0AAD1SCH4_PELCU|nr:Hypothetical predicted protein [Pelobates cultripes]